jgi:hypothetical protein
MTKDDDDRHDSNVAPFVPRDDDAADELDDDLDELFGFDDDDELEAEWDEADAEAVQLLKDALPELHGLPAPTEAIAEAAEQIRAGIAAEKVPYTYIPGAAGWNGKLPDEDRELWLGATGSLLAGLDEFPMPIEQLSTIMALQHGDWAGAVLGLIRAGIGAPAEPSDLVRYADECEEIEGEADPEDVAVIEEGFGYLLDLWTATGAIDDDRLTELGFWGLPRALAWAWQGDFDSDE